MKKLFIGLSYNFKGLFYFFQNKKLWKYAFIPFIINIIALVALISLYLVYFNELFAFITSPLGTLDIVNPENYWWHLLDAGLWVLRFLLQIVFFLLSFILIFFLVFILSSFLNSPFYELMAEHILIKHNILEDKPFKMKTFLSELKHSLKIEGYKILLFLALSLLILFFSWIPVLGALFSVLGLLFAAWVFAFGLSTYPMIIQKNPFKHMLGWAWQKKTILIGFGLPSAIPVLGLLIIHFQVVGGTLLYIENSNE